MENSILNPVKEDVSYISRKSRHSVRPTSKEKYEELVEYGTLAYWREKVLWYFIKYPNSCSKDCELYYGPKNYTTVASRITELKEAGLLEVTGTTRKHRSSMDTLAPTGRKNPLPFRKKLTFRGISVVYLKALISNFNSSTVSPWDKMVAKNALVESGYLPKGFDGKHLPDFDKKNEKGKGHFYYSE